MNIDELERVGIAAGSGVRRIGVRTAEQRPWEPGQVALRVIPDRAHGTRTRHRRLSFAVAAAVALVGVGATAYMMTSRNGPGRRDPLTIPEDGATYMGAGFRLQDEVLSLFPNPPQVGGTWNDGRWESTVLRFEDGANALELQWNLGTGPSFAGVSSQPGDPVESLEGERFFIPTNWVKVLQWEQGEYTITVSLYGSLAEDDLLRVVQGLTFDPATAGDQPAPK